MAGAEDAGSGAGNGDSGAGSTANSGSGAGSNAGSGASAQSNAGGAGNDSGNGNGDAQANGGAASGSEAGSNAGALGAGNSNAIANVNNNNGQQPGGGGNAQAGAGAAGNQGGLADAFRTSNGDLAANIGAATANNNGGNTGQNNQNTNTNTNANNGGAQGNTQGATGNVAINNQLAVGATASTTPNTVSRLGAVNTVGQTLQAAPRDFNTAEGAAPETDDLFNFNDGTFYDLEQEGLVAGSTRANQAREINSRIPTSIQFAFRRGDINYYDPGNGQYYYIRQCGAGNCNIIQVDRRTNSYRSLNDGQMHYINIDFGRSNINLFTNEGMAMGGMPYQIQQGDTINNVAARFGMSPSMLLAANPNVINGDNIVAGNTLSMPALAFTASAGDTMSSIALDTGVDMEILNALNPEIRNADAINAEQRIRVPPNVPNLPLAYTMQDGQSLPILSSLLALDQSDLETLNPGLANLGESATGQIAALPNFITSTGDISFTDTMTNPFANGLGDFNKRSLPTMSRKHARQVARRAIAV